MVKTRRAIAAVLAVVFVAVAVFMWLGGERRTRPVLASKVAATGSVAVRIDRFVWTRQPPGALKRQPPAWVVRYPWLEDLWSGIFREKIRVDEGLVWGLLDATVTSDRQLEWDDVAYRLDYGAYTIDSRQWTFQAAPGGPYTIATHFEVTDGPLPQALEIGIRGEWMRFPIERR